MSKLINLFAGPGAGKSSIAAGITYKLKKNHISCDQPYEFPKVLAWDENTEAIKDQLYVLANQHRGIAQSHGKVDYIVVDSPIMFSLIYKTLYNEGYPAKFYSQSFNQMIVDLHNSYDNINILLERSDEGVHNDKERYQTLEQSKEIDIHCKKILDDNNIPYHTIKVGEDTVNEIIQLIVRDEK
jgi:hypothetical protein